MHFFDSVLLGIVEGITEFLPISSTGHLILTDHLLGLTQSEFLKSFEIAIQLGAILAVVVLYWRKLFLSKKVFLLTTAAFVPTAVIGFGLYKVIKGFLLGSSVVVLWALALGGVALIGFELFVQKPQKPGHDPFLEKKGHVPVFEIEEMGYGRAIGVGLFQALAVIPGVSRSAATIVGGMLLRVSRATIVEFSFLLAIPTMAAATGYDLFKSGFVFSGSEFGLLAVGFLVSFLVALVAVKWLLKFIQSHTFVGFGVYRIVLAVLFGLFLF